MAILSWFILTCCGLIAALPTTALETVTPDQTNTRLAIPSPTSPSFLSSSPPVSKPPSNTVAPSFWPHQAPVDATGAPFGAPSEPTATLPTLTANPTYGAPTNVPSKVMMSSPSTLPSSPQPSPSTWTPSKISTVSPLPPSYPTQPVTIAPIVLTGSPIAPSSPPNLIPSMDPTDDLPTVTPYYQPSIWPSRYYSSDVPSSMPTSAPTDEPCTLDGSEYANGNTVATATKGTYKGKTTTDEVLKVQQKHISYYDGPLSFRIRYDAKFKKDGSFDSGTCKIFMICFTDTDPERKNKDTTIVTTSAPFQTIPMTDAKKDKDCTEVESFTCEGGPWYPKVDKTIELIDNSKLKGTFDLKNKKFDIPTCEYQSRKYAFIANYKSSGVLAKKSDRCEPPKKRGLNMG